GQWYSPPSSRDAWAARMELAAKGGMATFAGPTVERWFTAESITAALHGVERVRKMIESTPLNGFLACAKALQDFDARDDLRRIAIPTMLIAGARDGAMPQVMEQMHQAIPGSAYHVIEGAGHFPNIEKPGEFNRLLAEFAKAVARMTPRMKQMTPEGMDPDQ